MTQEQQATTPAWASMTVKTMLEAWDRGEPVHLVEMGGIGEEYEQALQLIAVAMIRYGHEHGFPTPDDPNARAEWELLGNRALTQELDEQIGGATGAQFGAALSEAAMILRNGYAEALSTAPAERIMAFTNRLPKLMTAEEAFEAGRRAIEIALEEGDRHV